MKKAVVLLLERNGRAATYQHVKGKCSTSSSTEILYWRIHWVPSSSFPRCCNFLRAPRSSFRREERRGGPEPGLWGLVPKRHSLRNLPMINDRLAARSFKQQSFPREKISRIRSERSKGLFLDLPFMIAPCPHSLSSLSWQCLLALLYFQRLLCLMPFIIICPQIYFESSYSRNRYN